MGDKLERWQEREYVRKSKYYTFDPDGTGRYRLPRLIVSLKNPDTKIDLKLSMRDGKISENEANFIYDLETMIKNKGQVVKEKPIKQFPIVIQNRELWKRCCEKMRVTKPEAYARQFFKADLFFPAYSLIVEIDSDLHDPNYDKARDVYLKNVGNLRIKTLRCDPYMIWDKKNKVYGSRNTERLCEIYEELEFLESCCVKSREWPRLDFLDCAVGYLKSEYRIEFDIITEMLKTGGQEIVAPGRKITKTMRENIRRLRRDIYGLETR